MGRSFLVWSLADMALREPAAKPVYLPVMDQIIGETLRLEREQGIYCFLMPYAKAQPFVEQPARSLFLDSELALMLASRRAVEEKAEYRPLLAERVAAMIERMRRSKVLAAESYPNECWLFDHSVALAAIRLADYLDGSDHSGFCREWIARAKEPSCTAKPVCSCRASPPTANLWTGRKDLPFGWRHTASGSWMRISPEISIAAPARNWAAYYAALRGRANGQYCGRGQWTSIRER